MLHGQFNSFNETYLPQKLYHDVFSVPIWLYQSNNMEFWKQPPDAELTTHTIKMLYFNYSHRVKQEQFQLINVFAFGFALN